MGGKVQVSRLSKQEVLAALVDRVARNTDFFCVIMRTRV